MITRFQPDDSIEEKIERSSLGDPEAKKMRARTPDAVAAQIVDESIERGDRRPRGSGTAKP